MKSNEEMYKLVIQEETKYTYYLLAITASAIAYSVEKTSGESLEWKLLVVMLAVLFWIVSFWLGCKNRVCNIQKLRNEMGRLSLAENDAIKDPEIRQKAIDSLWRKYDKLCERETSYFRWQFRLLITGIILFIVWRILKILQL